MCNKEVIHPLNANGELFFNLLLMSVYSSQIIAKKIAFWMSDTKSWMTLLAIMAINSFWILWEVYLSAVLLSHTNSSGRSLALSFSNCKKFDSSSVFPWNARPWRARNCRHSIIVMRHWRFSSIVALAVSLIISTTLPHEGIVVEYSTANLWQLKFWCSLNWANAFSSWRIPTVWIRVLCSWHYSTLTSVLHTRSTKLHLFVQHNEAKDTPWTTLH